MSRILDKMREIETALADLKEILPNAYEGYGEKKTKLSCERCTEMIVESMTDLAFLVVKEKKFEVPEDDINAFDILFSHKIINKELCDNLKNAKRMRNNIVHQYMRIDDQIVFQALKNELPKHARQFIHEVKKCQS